MNHGPRSVDEVARFPLAVNWRNGSEEISGDVIAGNGYLWLESTVDWPITQVPGTAATQAIELQGDSTRGPFYLSGTPIVVDGERRLRIDDLRVGSSDPNERLVSALTHFDYAVEVSTYYQRDGAARSISEPLAIPALEDAPAMSLVYGPNAAGNMDLHCETGANIEQFETQLDALQRLITFSSQRAATRHFLIVKNAAGAGIEVYRGVTAEPRRAATVDYRDFPVRLSRANTQTIIDRWWVLMEDLRPIPQILTSLRYDPGYVESDFFLLATVLDRLSSAWSNVPAPMDDLQLAAMKEVASEQGVPDYVLNNFPTFQARMDVLADRLSDDGWMAVRIDRTSWIASVKRHRNLVAHSLEQKRAHREFMTGPGLRALRDATDVMVTLIVAEYLGIDGQPLIFAAERLNVTRIKVHETYVLAFDNNGLVRPER